MNDPRNATIDPRNPAHHRGLGLPAGYYENLTPPPPPTAAEQRAIQAARADLERRLAAGTLSPFKSRG